MGEGEDAFLGAFAEYAEGEVALVEVADAEAGFVEAGAVADFAGAGAGVEE
jgi:hypothetical protein